VVLVLDRIERLKVCDSAVEDLLTLTAKMQEACETVENLKRVYKFQTTLMAKENSLAVSKPVFKVQTDPVDLLKSLAPKLWRDFDVDQMLALHYHFKITDFFFAEIMLDWISFKKPAQKVFDQLWRIIQDGGLNEGYVTALGNSVKTHCKVIIPAPDVAAPRYRKGGYSGSDDIINKLTDQHARITLDYEKCQVDGCILPKHWPTLHLTDTMPCYEIGAEDILGYLAGGHYHHDKVKHWFATEEKNGQRVLLSFVTNNLTTVLKKVKASKGIQITFLYLL